MFIRGIQSHSYIHLKNLTKRPVNHSECKALGFLFVFWRPQNSNSGGHNSIFIDKVSFTLHPSIRLIYANTNAKEQKICPSVSIQKSALKLVLCPPEWKKVEVFLQFLPRCNTLQFTKLFSFKPNCRGGNCIG